MRKTHLGIKFSTLLLLLVSCNDYENLDGEIPTNSNLKSYYIKGSQAKKAATKFASHFKKPLQSSGTEFRTTEGIVIDYESILVVENELEHTSYTFKVDSPEESETVFQNIAMIEKPNQTVTKLITYEMSEDFANRYTADLAPISKFEGTITIQTIAGEDCCSESEIVTVGGSDGGDSANDGTGWGIGTSGGSTGGSSDSPQRCPSGMHVRGNLQCIYTTASSNLVFLSQRTASPSTTTNNNNGTPPELCCIYDIGLYQEAIALLACETLTTATNTPNYKTKFNALNKPENFNAPQETGFALVPNTVGGYYNQDLLAIGNTALKPPSNAINFTHVHNKQMRLDSISNTTFDHGVKMLSPADLDIMSSDMLNNNTANGTFAPSDTFAVMISHEGIFAVVPTEDNITILKKDYDNFKKKYYKEAEVIIVKKRSTYNTDEKRKKALEKMLLKLISETPGYKGKLELFEGDATDPTNLKWTRKSLNLNNPEIIDQTPC